MFSRVGNMLVRRSLRPMMTQQPLMTVFAQRTYMKDLGLDSESLALREQEGEAKNLELWKEQVQATENALVLKTDDEIESYVLSIVKDYFRTTKKASLTLDSAFADHGLDSLDAIELVIRVEDELGYVIDAENLELFKKPRHFVNFIKQMEGYREEHSHLPMEGTRAEYTLADAFPRLGSGGGH